MVRIPVDEPTHILGLIAPDLAIEEPALGTVGACRLAGREAAPLVEAVGLEEPAQRRIGRHGRKIRVAVGERDEVIVVQLHTPALVRGVLGKDRLAYRAAHRRLLSGIGAQLAAQHPDGIALLLHGPVIPALDGGEAEAGMLIGYGMMPGALGECRNRSGELALRWGRRQ
jgi:hypothetical protein